MLRWVCLVITALVIAIGVLEYVWEATPLEMLRGDFGKAGRDPSVTVIRLGIAAWEMREFPWRETIARYEAEQDGKVHFEITLLPEGAFNSLLLFWRAGHTEYDVVVAYADEEIQPFIDYNRTAKDPAKRALLINVRDYLTEEQMNTFVPALMDGSSRKDPETGEVFTYEIPWMGEVLALNYNKMFFKMAGIDKVPETWEEVEEACRKLKGLTYDGRKIAPISLYFDQKLPFFGQNCYIALLAAFKEGRGVEDEKGRLDISSPEAVRVFKTLKRWYKAGYVSETSFVGDDVEKDLRVMRSAMYAHWQSRGLWAVADQGADVIGIAPSPGMKDAGSLIETYGCIIPKCSPIKEKAAEICYEVFCTDRYGFQSGVAKGFMRDGKKVGGGKMPAPKTMYEDPELPAGIKKLGLALNRGYSFPDATNWRQYATILVVEFQKYLRDVTPTAEEALAITRRRFAEEVYDEEYVESSP